MIAARFVKSTFHMALVVAGIMIGGFAVENTRISVHAQAPAPAPPPRPNRAMPDDNLAYPVLITLKNGGTGTGFYVNANKGMYFVTAKHVLFDMNTGALLDSVFDLLSYSKDLSDPTPNSLTVDTAVAGMNAIIKHPSQDIAVMKVASENPIDPNQVLMVPGVTTHTVAKLGFLGVALETIKRFDDVLVGNEAILLGYPTSLGLQTMPEIDPRRPLLRKGIVAGTNPRTHSLILDCPAYYGNSGSPVIEVDPQGFGHIFKIIGVVIKFVPFADSGRTFSLVTNSGYSVATPMDYVLELIK